MAAGATMFTFEVQLSDVDRGVYEEISVRAAQHPSETDAFLMTRVLAYCLEHAEGIAFGGGVSQSEEPAVLVRDMTGAILAWIEVGAPDAERLHRGSKLAERTIVYTNRDPARLLPQWAGKRIHRAESIVLRSLDPGFLDAAAAALARRTTMTVSVSDGVLYLDVNGTNLSSPIHEHPIA